MAVEKCCRTCRFYASDWGSSCLHPEFARFDKVDGTQHPMPEQVIKRCELRLWEKPPSLFDRLRSLFRKT